MREDGPALGQYTNHEQLLIVGTGQFHAVARGAKMNFSQSAWWSDRPRVGTSRVNRC